MYDEERQTLTSNPRTSNPMPAQNKRRQQTLPQKILSFFRAIIWVSIAGGCLYYTNFFYQLFHNPNIYQPFFTISMSAYTILVIIALYISFVVPLVYGVDNIEEFNPRLVPIGAVSGAVAVLTLLIAIWPVWGFTSFLIFICLWKGFFEVATLLPGGKIGGVLFVGVNVLAVFSYKIIDHEGYLH